MNEAAEQQSRAAFYINAQYIKDLSFEAPNSPAIFREQVQPEISVSLNIEPNQLESNVFEVAIKFNIEAKGNGKTAFLLELEHACVCTLNVPEEHVEPMLLIEIPRFLFPFSRNIISDLTRDGGFPPLMLNPLDFAGLYQQRLQARANQPTPETIVD